MACERERGRLASRRSRELHDDNRSILSETGCPVMPFFSARRAGEREEIDGFRRKKISLPGPPGFD
jgi:hypothetical protein